MATVTRQSQVRTTSVTHRKITFLAFQRPGHHYMYRMDHGMDNPWMQNIQGRRSRDRLAVSGVNTPFDSILLTPNITRCEYNRRGTHHNIRLRVTSCKLHAWSCVYRLPADSLLVKTGPMRVRALVCCVPGRHALASNLGLAGHGRSIHVLDFRTSLLGF